MRRRRDRWLAVRTRAALTAIVLASSNAPLSLAQQDPPSPQSGALYRVAEKKIADDLAKVDALVRSNGTAADAARSLIEQASAPAAGSPATPAQAVATVSDAVATARLYNAQARQLQDEARAAATAAGRTSDPARKAQSYLDAMTKLDAATRAARIATESLGGFNRTTRSNAVWSSLKDLQQRAAVLQASPTADVFDGAIKQAEMAAGRNGGTNAFSIKSYDEQAGKAVLRDGTTIDLTPLQRAVRNPNQGGTGRPLLREVPLPQGSTFVPDVASHNALVAQASNAPGVGGVALRFTLAALEATGLPDLRWDTPLVEVEKPVLISLNRLYEALRPYASSDATWASLPEALRYPGAIARIQGFVQDAERKDVWLIGNKADSTMARLDVDAIILALRIVWRDDKVPMVSLDRQLDDPASPNVPRIIALPPDSVVARTMLDADYLLKNILHGTVPTRVDGYRSLTNLVETSGNPDLNFVARFWFQPAPLAPASIRRSASRRTFIYNVDLQVLTESMLPAGGALSGAARASSDSTEQAALLFTRNLAKITASHDADPQRLIERLRGIADAVALAKLLRHFSVDAARLADLAGLPSRRLVGSEAVPREYDVVRVTTVTIDSAGRAHTGIIFGGVDLRVLAQRRSVIDEADAVLAAVETLVDAQAARAPSASKSASVGPSSPWLIEPAFSLRAPAGQRNDRAAVFETALITGVAALADGNAAKAVQEFRRAVEIDGASAQAQGWLAYASLWAHDLPTARAGAGKAIALDPQDDMVRAIAYDVDRRTGAAGAGADAVMRQRLVAFYVNLANGARPVPGGTPPPDWAAEALRVDPQSPDALVLHGLQLLRADDHEAALAAFQDGRKVLTAKGRDALRADPERAQVYAMASVGAALAIERRFLKGLSEFDRKYPYVDPAKRMENDLVARSLLPEAERRRIERARAERLEDLIKAAAEQYEAAGDALAVQPTGTTAGVQLLGLVHRVQATMRLSSPKEIADLLKQVRAEAAKDIALYPKADLVYGARATLMLSINDVDEALADIDRAIAIAPGKAGNLRMRARIYSLLDRCENARADLAAARAITPQDATAEEAYRRHCGGP